MVKDRMQELRAAQADNDHHVVIITENTSLRNQMEEFLQEVEQISDSIDRMQINVTEVDKLHAQIINAPKTDDKMKQQLEDLMDDIKRNASRIRTKLKAIEQNIEQLEKSGAVGADYRIRKIQHSMLLQKFIDCMNFYNVTQTNYREKCKERIQRQLEITGSQKTDEEIETMLESGNPTIFTQDILTDTKEAKQLLADIEARHADIIKLENSIREMHDMFIDMALLIENQGEIIDRIETQVISSKEYVEDGKKETVKALAFQSKSRRKKLCIMICLSVLVVFIVSSVVSVIFA